MKMYNLLYAAVTVHSTINQPPFSGWLVEELQRAVSAQLFLQISADSAFYNPSIKSLNREEIQISE